MKLQTQRIILAVAVLVAAALVALVAIRGSTIGVAGSALIQAISVGVSVYGGVLFAKEGNAAAITTAAVKSVRRVLANYNQLGRLAAVIERLRADLAQRSADGRIIELQWVDLSLQQLSDLVINQIDSADIAVRDWQDLAPTDVAAEVGSFKDRQQGES